MEKIDVLMLIVYLILQVVIGGMIFNGLRKLFRIISRKEIISSPLNLIYLIVGVFGLSFFLIWNTLRLIDKY